jgi:protocatechuate 3,4-dioxygenase beta subunit
MSKNLTRKGLAFGALVALGSSVVAGAPANAAPTSLAIASSFGTSTSTILGLDFNVAVTAAGLATSSVSGNENQFKLFVEGAVAGDFKAATTASRSVTDLTTAEGSTYNTDSADITTVSATDKTSVVSAIDTDAATYTQIKLGLSSSAVTATRTIKVTPFVDNIVADGKITAGELAGTPISITYVKGSEVTATTTLAAPVIGGTDLSATVTLDKSINLEQVVASNTAVKVFFKKNGAYALTSDAVSKVDAVWSKADAALKASLSGVSGIGSNEVYSATALINDLASGNVSTGTATAGETELVNTSVTGGELTSTKGANVQIVSTSYGVRTGTTSVAITSSAAKKLNDDSNEVAAAGVPAKVTVTATTLATGSKFTAGGKTVDTQGESISFATVTNADGKVAFDLGATGAKLDKATVAVSILDKTSNYLVVGNTGYTETWTWIDATPNTAAIDLDVVGTSSPVRTVKAGGSYTLNYALTDDFGALYTKTDRRVNVTITGASGVVAALNQNVVFSGGKASLTVTDANSDNGYYDVVAQLQTYTASSDSWANGTGTTVTTRVYVQKNVTAGFLTATADSTSAAIDYDALTAQDARLDANSTDLSVYGSAATVSGSVLDTDGTVLEGASVTLSGAGLLFKSGDVATVGSITVLANASGQYSVEVSSNKAGKQTVTVTSGSLSKTATPDFGSALASSAENITITAPANATPGSTTAVTVKLTDKFGNAVKTDGASGLTFTVRVSGVGSTGSFTEATNADGEVKFNQVLGSADTGSFVVTVKYDGDAATATKAAITKTATVAVAAVAAVVVEPTSKIGTANSRVYVNVKDGKGSVVSVKIGAKWYTKSALNNDYTFSFKAKAKSKVSVKVYVDGDLSSSKTIIVKK